jgi:cytochrome c
MEAFMPSEKFHNPVDMIMNKKDGALYIIEYGSKWFSKNEDARLIRIDFIEGNRKPKIQLTANKTKGAAPFTVQFSTNGTEDYDRHDLEYEWNFIGNKVQSTEKNPSFTFDKIGKYTVRLKVTDEVGSVSTSNLEIEVGNDMPKIAWELDGNTTFYFDNDPINYNVNVSDKEDGTIGKGIDENQVIITMDYLKEGFDQTEIAQGHQTILTNVKTGEGKKLMNDSDCKACHLMDEKSAGPSYQQIAKKYEAEKDKVVSQLANRIIKGGTGVWGETQMSAHPQLTTKEAENMVHYILSLNEKIVRYEPKGIFTTKEHLEEKTAGNYVFTASYTDKGANDFSPSISQNVVVLRPSKLLFKNVDEHSAEALLGTLYGNEKNAIQVPQNEDYEWMRDLIHDEYLMFKEIDLTEINKLLLHIPVPKGYFEGGFVEIRLDSKNGEIIGKADLNLGKIKPFTTTLKATKGKHDIYFVFKNWENQKQQIAGAISVTFFK